MTNEANDRADLDAFFITGKDLERHFNLEDALFEFSRLFRHAEPSDRALAVVGGAFLDILLEHILVAFLVNDEREVAEMLRYDQPLGTFGSRIRAAYCLGLISRTIRDDLRSIAKIRNKFAHNLYASFDDQQIRAWCAALQWHRKAYMEPPPAACARDLFHVGVNQLVCHLNGIVSIARSDKRLVRSE